MRILYIASLSALLSVYVSGATAQVLTSRQIDSVAERALQTFNVPGIAVAVIKDGKVVHAKGYGVRSLQSPQKVDERTLFGIASNSKAFTATALAILVDEGKLGWDDKVTDHIPEFRMSDAYVTSAFTIKDLLTHRSGLGLGIGDLMFFPDSSDFTKKDLIHNLRYFKPVSPFRTQFDYDNSLYIVAGEVVARVSGMSWEDFIEKRILIPLGMTRSAASFSRLKDASNVIAPHAPVNGKVQVIRRDFNELCDAAGGIYSNIEDMSKWVMLQLNKGKYGDGLSKQLFSQPQHMEMWMPQTIIRARGGGAYNNHFVSYGLGWFLSDEKGNKVVTHTGGLAGIVTQVTIIPDLNLGVLVFTNQESSAAFKSITNSIKDGYYGVEGHDWIKETNSQLQASRAEEAAVTGKIWKEIEQQQRSAAVKYDTAVYAGTYKDVWLGEATISLQNGKLRFNAKRAPRLAGDIMPYKANTFVVKWDERNMNADAFIMFSLDENGKAEAFKMKPISPLTDFSYDFQDLDFRR
ncbi:MAG TPA: serine hydrolase [Chitinophaga sp.]|uniref:serine hydrolase n=1 Tax=Chitinophaga sp. TaxID=1869181 RepID=UPI002C0E1E9D|nr:serine hydrolase [Chitinophaga sp.]HVI47925.1 serine hydrolase [Chitinophaga sp.]